MRVILDTHLLIWSLYEPRRLPGKAVRLLEDDAHEIFFSAASVWEIAIKAALRRPGFDVDPARLLSAARLDFAELPVTSDTAIRVTTLPLHHRDPFDRLLLAQAIDAGAALLTVDRALARYGDPVMTLG